MKLTRAIAAHLSRLHPVGEQMQEPLQDLSTAVARAVPRPSFVSPLHRYGPQVMRAARCGIGGAAHGIATELLDAQAALPWVYHYPPISGAEGLVDRIAFAELIGPDGPLDAPASRVGFTMMAEHTYYPMHVHPAVELYLTVSGRGQWQTPALNRILPPGELILHRASEPHAMRTFDEPLLALWGWSGDIDAPSIYL